MDVRHDNNALQESNDCIGGLLHLGLNFITFRTLLHLVPNVITFRTLLHLGELLHLGLQQAPPKYTGVFGVFPDFEILKITNEGRIRKQMC